MRKKITSLYIRIAPLLLSSGKLINISAEKRWVEQLYSDRETTRSIPPSDGQQQHIILNVMGHQHLHDEQNTGSNTKCILTSSVTSCFCSFGFTSESIITLKIILENKRAAALLLLNERVEFTLWLLYIGKDTGKASSTSGANEFQTNFSDN